MVLTMAKHLSILTMESTRNTLGQLRHNGHTLMIEREWWIKVLQI